jgi:pimeloyl-ACP methyl ester carboxylesterase
VAANVSVDASPRTFVLIPGAGADPRVYEATIAANAQYEGVPAPGLFAEPLPLAAWPDVPTTVLAGRDDRLFPLAFQQRVARERLGSGEVAEIDGGHLPMLARPRELAERLVDLA